MKVIYFFAIGCLCGLLNIVFNGKGEVLAGNINLEGEYIDKLKDESELIYRAC